MDRTATLVWGEQGLASAGAHSVCVIVDVLSFSTSVVAACDAGARVYPYRWKDDTAASFAEANGAELAVQRQDAKEGQPSLSPPSLTILAPETRLVLPSPNGSTLTTRASAPSILCGCLRNAGAIARFINRKTSGSIVVVAAGERWPDSTLRPALEDILGAGKILAGLDCVLDVEAQAAEALYQNFSSKLMATIEQTSSGKELIDRGFRKDVDFAVEVDASACVPVLQNGAFINVA